MIPQDESEIKPLKPQRLAKDMLTEQATLDIEVLAHDGAEFPLMDPKELLEPT